MQEQNQSDGQLLAAFVARRDEQAFAGIVERHGRMLLRVAGGILGDDQEAKDVIQATFLTLVRKAPQLRTVDNLGPWLHRVAHDVAVDAVRRRERRRCREQEEARMNEPMSPNGLAESLTSEQRRLLQDELGRLPDRYRAPLVLCYLEGVGADEAARALGLAGATLRKRLERGRDRLRRRLARLGWVVGAGALTALLSAESGGAVLPATIVASTVSAATGGAVSTTVAALTKGALNMLFWNSVKTAALTAACAGVVGTSVVVAQRSVSANKPIAGEVYTEIGRLAQVFPEGGLVIVLEVHRKETWRVTESGERTNEKIPAHDTVISDRYSPAEGHAAAVKAFAAKYKAGDLVKVFWCRDAHGNLRVLRVAGATDALPAEWGTIEKSGRGGTGRDPYLAQSGREIEHVGLGASWQSFKAGASPVAATGDPGKVFKPVDQSQPGFYADGKWSYALEIKGDQRQGFLKYDGKNVGDSQPGDHILTPWGWMQWQEQGNWLPVTEKPAKGNQLPDPAQ